MISIYSNLILATNETTQKRKNNTYYEFTLKLCL